MQRALSFLYRWIRSGTMSLWPSRLPHKKQWKTYALLYSCLGALHATAYGYTVVSLSTSAPAGLESQFIASATSQYLSTLTANPFVGNTYTLVLKAINPAYQPPAPAVDPNATIALLLNQIDKNEQYMENVDSYTYVFGWASGLQYQNSVDEGEVAGFDLFCSTPTKFNLVLTSSSTFDRKTCSDTLDTILQTLYTLNISTPPIVGAGF